MKRDSQRMSGKTRDGQERSGMVHTGQYAQRLSVTFKGVREGQGVSGMVRVGQDQPRDRSLPPVPPGVGLALCVAYLHTLVLVPLSTLGFSLGPMARSHTIAHISQIHQFSLASL